MERFYVAAPSVNSVKRALGKTPPGGVEVVGRYDNDLIECRHTMDERSLARHWAVIVSRLGKAGLKLAGPTRRGT